MSHKLPAQKVYCATLSYIRPQGAFNSPLWGCILFSMKAKKVYKSAVSGRFVGKKYSEKRGKKTTFTEKVVVRKMGGKKKK